MTNSIEDLQNLTLAAGDEISHSDVGDRIPEVWAGEIERAADAARIMRNFAIVNTDLVGKPGSIIKMPKRAYIDMVTYPVKTIAADTDAVSIDSELTFETVTLEPTEVGLGSSITQQAIDEVMISLLDNVKEQLGYGIAQREDLDIIAAITLEAASGSAVYAVEAGAAGAIDFVSKEWEVGQLAADQTNLTSTDKISLPLIAEAAVMMDMAGFEADSVIIHPRQKSDLLKDDLFIDASQAGSVEHRKKGVIGELYGLSIAVSKNLNTLSIETDGSGTGYQALMLDKSAAVGLAIKRPVTIETEYKPQMRRHYIYATTMYKAGRLNIGAIVLMNTA